MSLISTLRELGVDTSTPFSYRHYKYTAGESMMPLSVELWNDGARDFIAVSHYGVQNGDCMADPDMLFEYVNGELLPVHYQNDYWACSKSMGVRGKEVRVNFKLDLQLRAFANSWAREIEAYGYKLSQEIVKAAARRSASPVRLCILLRFP